MERKIIMKKIIALIVVFASITTVWAVKNASDQSSGEPSTENTQSANAMFDLVATGDFKLDDVVGKGYPVIINFSATWCGPCKKMKPIFKEANEAYKGKAILKTIDVDDASMKDIVAAAGVTAIPHQIFFYPDGTTPSKEKSPKLFTELGVREIFNKKTFSSQVSRTGAMDRDTIDKIIKELNVNNTSEAK